MLFLFFKPKTSSTALSELTKIVYYDKVLADSAEKRLENKKLIKALQINAISYKKTNTQTQNARP